MGGSGPLDPTAWYNIVVKAGNGSWVLNGGSAPSDATGTAKPLWNNKVDNLAHQMWQFWPVADSTYLVRCADFGSTMFLSGWNGTKSATPILKNPAQYPDDESMLWKVTPGLDSYYGMTNQGNGTGLELAVDSTDHWSTYWGAVLQSSNAVDSKGQARLHFEQVATVDRSDFQALQTPAVASKALASSTASNSATPMGIIDTAPMGIVDTAPGPTAAGNLSTAAQSHCPDVSGSSGLSAGTSAGISCAVTLVVCSLIFGLAFVLLDRKFKRQAKAQESINELRGWERGHKEASEAAMAQVQRTNQMRIGELGPGRMSTMPELYQGVPQTSELDTHGYR